MVHRKHQATVRDRYFGLLERLGLAHLRNDPSSWALFSTSLISSCTQSSSIGTPSNVVFLAPYQRCLLARSSADKDLSLIVLLAQHQWYTTRSFGKMPGCVLRLTSPFCPLKLSAS